MPVHPLPDQSLHNTAIFLALLVITYWAYTVYKESLIAVKLLKQADPPLALPGVAHLVNELQILSRRHLEQVVAASMDLRHPPSEIQTVDLVAHIEPGTVSISGNSVTVELLHQKPVSIFAIKDAPFTLFDSENQTGNQSAEIPSSWIDTLWVAFWPFSKRRLHTSFGSGSRAHAIPLNLARMLNDGMKIGGTGRPGSSKITIPVGTIEGSKDVSLLFCAGDSTCIEVSLCKVAGRIEVVEQIVCSGEELLAISGLYGFEDSTSPECMICCDRKVDTVLLPCCHCSLCEPCAYNLRDGRCPICRTVYQSFVTLPVHSSEQRQTPQSRITASAHTPLLSASQ